MRKGKTMQISEIHGEFIKLNQWLKKENLVESGGEANITIEERRVKVNGETATQLRKKLHHGDIVTVEGQEPYEIRVVS